MTIFFLIRHGETDWSINERYLLKGEYRDLPPLTPNGIMQAKNLSKDARLNSGELILSSPYTRALQTAAILSKSMDLDISVELDLREWIPDLNLRINNLAELQLSIDDYTKENGIYPLNASKSWEEKSAMQNRVKKVLIKYLGYEYVIVISHEQVIKSLVNNGDVPYCSINVLELNN